MTENILERIGKNYFQGLADDLSNEKNISTVFPNISDVGDTRENILLKLLQLHIPSRCSVARGGFIYDSEGNESKQMDLIISNDYSLHFRHFNQNAENSKTMQSVEGALAAITIKSTLNKKELLDGLDNLASIPPMPTTILKCINPMLSNREQYLEYPLKIIFAFSKGTQSIADTLTNINLFYNNKSINNAQKAKLIIVNNSFYITQIGKDGGTTLDGTRIEPFSYHPIWDSNNENRFGALPLITLLTYIQKTCLFCPHVLFDYENYFSKVNFWSDQT